jgi:hypothetical protein
MRLITLLFFSMILVVFFVSAGGAETKTGAAFSRSSDKQSVTIIKKGIQPQVTPSQVKPNTRTKTRTHLRSNLRHGSGRKVGKVGLSRFEQAFLMKDFNPPLIQEVSECGQGSECWARAQQFKVNFNAGIGAEWTHYTGLPDYNVSYNQNQNAAGGVGGNANSNAQGGSASAQGGQGGVGGSSTSTSTGGTGNGGAGGNGGSGGGPGGGGGTNGGGGPGGGGGTNGGD